MIKGRKRQAFGSSNDHESRFARVVVDSYGYLFSFLIKFHFFNIMQTEYKNYIENKLWYLFQDHVDGQ